MEMFENRKSVGAPAAIDIDVDDADSIRNR